MASKYRKTISFKSEALYNYLKKEAEYQNSSESRLIEDILQKWYLSKIKEKNKKDEIKQHSRIIKTKNNEYTLSRYHWEEYLRFTLKVKGTSHFFKKPNGFSYSFINDEIKINLLTKIKGIHLNFECRNSVVLITKVNVTILPSPREKEKEKKPWFLRKEDDKEPEFLLNVIYHYILIPLDLNGEIISEYQRVDILNIKYRRYIDMIHQWNKPHQKIYIINATKGTRGAYFIKEKQTSTEDIFNSIIKHGECKIITSGDVFNIKDSSKEKIKNMKKLKPRNMKE